MDAFSGFVFGHVPIHLSTNHHLYRSTLHLYCYELPKLSLRIPQEGESQAIKNQRENRRNSGQCWRRRPLSSGLTRGIRGYANRTLQSPLLTDCTGGPTVPGPVHVGGSSAGKTDWIHTAASAAKMLLRTVERASEGFPPLKSVATGLCSILDNCEV